MAQHDEIIQTEDEQGGEVRKFNPLGMTLADPTTVTAIFDKAPTIPREELRPKILAAWAPPIANQNGIGMCNASTTTEMLQILRDAAGLPHVDLSAGSLYGQLTQSDNGSLPEDAIKKAMAVGVVPVADMAYLAWRSNQFPAGWKEKAAPYKMLDGGFINTIDDAFTLINLDKPINICMMWGNGDSNPDQHGVQSTQATGKVGGHSVTGVGLLWIEAVRKFGPFATIEQHIEWFKATKPKADIEAMCFVEQNHWSPNWPNNIKGGRSFIPCVRLAQNTGTFKMFWTWSVLQETIPGVVPG